MLLLSTLAFFAAVNAVNENVCTKELQCADGDNANAPCGEGELLGYRSGACNECSCCPRCWTCSELLAYDCTQRNGLSYAESNATLTLTVGDTVSWSLPSGLSPATGWLQCAMLPSLPPGLAFDDEGSLSGKIGYDWQETSSYNRVFEAISTFDWAEAHKVAKLRLTFTVVNTIPANFDRAAEDRRYSPGKHAARKAASSAFAAYEAYDQRKLSHDEAVDRMKMHLSELRSVLDMQPRLENGMMWGWLGGLHMNVHKLMENVLLECEAYLGAALLFPSSEVRAFGRENLAGCYAKRQLEAAKFPWLDGMGKMLKKDWAGAKHTLELAASKKDGWGWGVNNGDIWISLGAVQLIEWGEAQVRDDAGSSSATMAGLEEANATLQKAANRTGTV